MVVNNVIEPVDTPTDWCAPIVAVPKANGDVRICVDLTKVNTSVKREIYVMPTVEETLSKIAEGNVFSKFNLHHTIWTLPIQTSSGQHHIGARVFPEEGGQHSSWIAGNGLSYGRYLYLWQR